jgi:predicted lipoprotein with Yx(FWY)xxD motif
MFLRAGFLGALAVLAASGASADETMPAGVGMQKTVYGDVLADAHRMTLYSFDQDKAGKSACDGPCAHRPRSGRLDHRHPRRRFQAVGL